MDKFLTPFEKQFLRKNSQGEYLAQSIAGFYALKEAASKALGSGISTECGFFDIIILKDNLGCVCAFYSPKTTNIFNLNADGFYENEKEKRFFNVDFNLLGVVDFSKCKYIETSISHDGGMAMAVASFIKG